MLALALTLGIVGTIVANAPLASALATKLTANGQMDFVYGPAVDDAGGTGTTHKPESKLFYTGGTGEPVRWWAVLGTSGPSPAAGVWLFELVNHSWVARVGLPAADPWAKADALFEDGTLYVSTRDNLASTAANPRQSSLYEIRYTGAGSWGAVQGPFSITTASPETLTLAKDSAGRLWVTYESGGQIRAGHTAPGGTSFTFVTVSKTNVTADDIAAVTAFGGDRIGVFWSDQVAHKDFFAWRSDGAAVTAPWTVETAYGGGVGSCPTATSDLCADDHLNIKVYQDQVYVSVKSSLNDAAPNDPNDPLNSLLRRSSNGTWSAFPINTVAQNVTRPVTLLSPAQDRIWVWGTRGAEVDVWETSFSSPAFTSTGFVPWTKASSGSPGDATTTKQLTTTATGAVVMSSTSSRAEYWHNEFLPGSTSTNTAPTAQDVTATATAGQTKTITLTGTDAETCELTFDRPNATLGSGATVSGPVNAPCTGTGPFGDTATVSYTAPAGFSGSDSFTYTVDDGSARSNAATVAITVGSSSSTGIALRGASTGANNVGTSVTIPVPAGVQAADALVAVVDVKAAPTVAAPSGWAVVSSTPNGSNFKQVVYSKVATAGEPASHTWSFNESRAASGAILAYAGVNTTMPVETFSARTGTTASITAPSVVSSSDGAMIVGAFGIDADSAISPPTGMTERGEIVAATRIRTEVADGVLGSAGATGDKIATAAAAAANVGQLIALRPAGATGGNTAPVAQNVTTTATAGQARTITLTGTDTQTCELTFNRPAASLPSGATVSAASNAPCTGTGPFQDTATVTYTAPTGFSGTDSFTYTVNDGSAGSNTATVNVTVSAPSTGGITLRTTSVAANAIANNLAIPVPTGTQAGDVMLAVVDVKASPTVTGPTGWTLVSNTVNGSNLRQLVYWRVATPMEPGGYTWSYGENRAASGAIMVYSGVHATAPVETFSAATGSTTEITAPSVSSSFDGARIVGAFGIGADSAISPPAGMTERGEIASAARLRTEVADYVLGPAGPTGAKTATAVTAAPNIGQLIVVRPA